MDIAQSSAVAAGADRLAIRTVATPLFGLDRSAIAEASTAAAGALADDLGLTSGWQPPIDAQEA